MEELEVLGAFVTFTHVPGLQRGSLKGFSFFHISGALYVVLSKGVDVKRVEGVWLDSLGLHGLKVAGVGLLGFSV